MRNFQQKKSRGRGGPSFDHGEHLHFLFGGRNGEDIVKVQGSESAGILMSTRLAAQCTELILGGQRIKFLRKFILYCIRRGARSIFEFGAKIKKIVGIFYNLFKSFDFDEIDNNLDSSETCNYIEQKKRREKKYVNTLLFYGILIEYSIASLREWTYTRFPL